MPSLLAGSSDFYRRTFQITRRVTFLLLALSWIASMLVGDGMGILMGTLAMILTIAGNNSCCLFHPRQQSSSTTKTITILTTSAVALCWMAAPGSLWSAIDLHNDKIACQNSHLGVYDHEESMFWFKSCTGYTLEIAIAVIASILWMGAGVGLYQMARQAAQNLSTSSSARMDQTPSFWTIDSYLNVGIPGLAAILILVPIFSVGWKLALVLGSLSGLAVIGLLLITKFVETSERSFFACGVVTLGMSFIHLIWFGAWIDQEWLCETDQLKLPYSNLAWGLYTIQDDCNEFGPLLAASGCIALAWLLLSTMWLAKAALVAQHADDSNPVAPLMNEHTTKDQI